MTKELLKGMEKGEVSPPRDMPSGPPARCVNILFRRRISFSNSSAIRTDQEIGIEIGEKLEKEIEEKGILPFSRKRNLRERRSGR